MTNFQEIVSEVMSAGIIIYPIYMRRDSYIDGKYFAAFKWYIRVEMPTRIITYDKPVATGYVLDSSKHPEYNDAIKKTYKHLYKEIKQKLKLKR